MRWNDALVQFDEGLKVVADALQLDLAKLRGYAAEDEIGGFHHDPTPGKWPVGSVWSVDGKILYAVTRALLPKLVIEVGTNYGCSAAHFCAALDANKQGELLCMDLDFSHCQTNHARMRRFENDAVAASRLLAAVPPDERAAPDLLFEDGEHTAGFTRDILRAWIPVMKPGGVVICHDAEHFNVGLAVRQGMGDGGCQDIHTVLIAPSDCGLGLWRKP